MRASIKATWKDKPSEKEARLRAGRIDRALRKTPALKGAKLVSKKHTPRTMTLEYEVPTGGSDG